MTADETVTAFIKAASAKDFDRVAELAAEDILYHNMPMEPVTGIPAMRDVLAIIEDGEWIVHRQLAVGDVVMNERTDRLKVNGIWVELPVAGVFEVHDGRVTLWRDYFDMQMIVAAMTPTS
jgi:limonene-1,2-epoxide hydrolase